MFLLSLDKFLFPKFPCYYSVTIFSHPDTFLKSCRMFQQDVVIIHAEDFKELLLN